MNHIDEGNRFSIFYTDEEFKKAELLWLWYDYKTEMYNRFLGGVPSEHDKTKTMVHENLKSLSVKYMRNSMYVLISIARKYGISNIVLDEAELDSYRIRSNAQKRVDEYLIREADGEMQFIHDLVEE